MPAQARVLAAALLLAVAGLGGCAAMVRTWDFQAGWTEGAGWRLELPEARVSQKSAAFVLVLRDLGVAPVAVEWGRPLLRLPDGTALRGAAPDVERVERHLQGRLADLGVGDRPAAPVLQPGGTVEARMVFRSPARDLRRQPEMELLLPELRFDGKPVHVLPIRLAAPPEAPTGEGI